RRPQCAHKVGGSAAVAAADLQYLFAAEIRLRCRAVVELDAEPAALIGRRQRQCHWRILLIAVVEKNDVLRIPPAGEERVPVVVHDLFEPRSGADGLDVIPLRRTVGHTEEYARWQQLPTRAGL